MNKLFALAIVVFCGLVAYGCGSSAPQNQPATLPITAPTSVPTSVASTAVPTATSNTHYALRTTQSVQSTWVPPTALVGTPIPGAEATLTAAPRLQTGTLIITNSAGGQVKVRVEIADTGAARELGLMFRSSMPPEAGMLFDFGGETQGTFWMQNTILPLSIAFIAGDGTILNTEDMQPLNTDSVVASGPYHYALEANQGFYRAHNINKGDKVTLPVDTATGAPLPGMPACRK